jgi:hypothetical protein
MKAYLITTGTLFGLLAVAHVWRVIAEWPALVTDPGAAVEGGIGVVAAALCVWAWRLTRRAAPQA